mmetsp:Transcript_4863/g.14723  ORF Transcript_4863/g.14723 Transcript_4863/m.14723 type:complete len:121 (-) Transcript_4863:166-528(-)|eukprot:scaffold258383_cov28-Tisochrysis_lutea.AAC.3
MRPLSAGPRLAGLYQDVWCILSAPHWHLAESSIRRGATHSAQLPASCSRPQFVMLVVWFESNGRSVLQAVFGKAGMDVCCVSAVVYVKEDFVPSDVWREQSATINLLRLLRSRVVCCRLC